MTSELLLRDSGGSVIAASSSDRFSHLDFSSSKPGRVTSWVSADGPRSAGIKCWHYSARSQTASAHSLPPPTRKLYFVQSPVWMAQWKIGGNGRKGGGKVRIVLFDWKQPVGLRYRDVLRTDKGEALTWDCSWELFHLQGQYVADISQGWFINSQLCALAHRRTCFVLGRTGWCLKNLTY